MNKLRVMIADDERPAREYLKGLLSKFDDVLLIGEAENGSDALELIKAEKPDLAFLDLQMPELTGLEVVGMLAKSQMPLVAFVTAFDDFAVKAFELNAIDYLLKPVERARLEETLQRAAERLERDDWRESETERLRNASAHYDSSSPTVVDRIPVKRGENIVLVPTAEIASVVADGELLHITTSENQGYTINFRLKDLEARLGPDFVRLSRGSLVNLRSISLISPLPGGTFLVNLENGQELSTSRLQSRVLRSKLLKL
jgi:two-component system LytT family response regulator